eukprot:10973-Heterococcus_DN1.PRE.2
MNSQTLTARFISASIDCKRGQLFIAQNAGNMDTILGYLALEELVVPVWPSTPEALEACEAFPASPTITSRCMMAGLPLYTQFNILSLLGDCSQLLPKLPLLDLLSQYVFGCKHSDDAPAASTSLDVNSAALVAALCCDLYRSTTFSQQQLERVNDIAAAANR